MKALSCRVLKFMKSGMPVCLAALVACSPGAPHPATEASEHGQREWRNASMRLTVVDESPALGGRLRLSLELHNRGMEPLSYDSSGFAIPGTIEVAGPDGPVRCIAPVSMVLALTQELAPGATVFLLKDHDISAEYLFERPGKVQIQVTSGLEFPKPEGGFHPVNLVSNPVTITIQEGRPATIVEVFRRIKPILREGWEVRVSGSEAGIGVQLLHPSNFVDDTIWLEIGGPARPGRTPIGESPWGTVRLPSNSALEEKLRAALLNALSRK